MVLLCIYMEEEKAKELRDWASDDSGFFADEVPEQARFLDVVAHQMSDQPFRFALSCTRHLHEGSEEIELLRYECSDVIGDHALVQ